MEINSFRENGEGCPKCPVNEAQLQNVRGHMEKLRAKVDEGNLDAERFRGEGHRLTHEHSKLKAKAARMKAGLENRAR